ncbi:hypothetical protein M011DRAFT_469690, partial [Sporormia fimetaria CBS 119925]
MDLGWFSGMSVRVPFTGGDIKTVKSRLSEKDIVYGSRLVLGDERQSSLHGG